MRYTFHEIEETWIDARNSCLSLGGDLSSITNEREQEIITANLNGSWWIGLYEERKGSWEWADEEVANWFNFVRRQPDDYSVTNGGDAHHLRCAVIMSGETGHWVDSSCNESKHQYVCKHKGQLVCELIHSSSL